MAFDKFLRQITGKEQSVYGICTDTYVLSELDYERQRLYEKASKLFDEVILVDTRACSYQFLRQNSKPIILHHGRDITHINALHIRGRRERESSTAILARTLSYLGCHISDPVKQLPIGKATKLVGTLERFKKQIGADSFLAFDYANAMRMVESIADKTFPLIAKPIDGRRGEGIELLEDFDAVENYIEEFIEQREDLDIPIFLQKFIDYRNEFRVFIIDGRVLGVVEKHQMDKSKITANAAQGGEFKQVENPAVAKFALAYVRKQGIYGVDVAIDSVGDLHIIESNRTPQFAAFEGATGIDVASEILQSAKQNIQKLQQKEATKKGKKGRK